jgi:hypothetical protein
MRKIFSFLSPLFDPKRFIEEITQKSPNSVGVSFTNKKAPVRRLFELEAFHLILFHKLIVDAV